MLVPDRYEEGRPMLLAGLRRHHPYAGQGDGISAQWREFLALGPLPGQRPGATYGVMCGADAGGFEYLSGVEVDSFAALPAGLGRVRVLPQYYAVFRHAGPVTGIRETWQRILQEWLPDGGHESAHKPDFEVYGPGFDPGTGLGGVEIWISIAR
ncbi:MAG: GyrI-like domain-containing protein [Gammaproteobacteria bacterium]|nr:GyrI-like domain-containing protein [Gammaproteobacteria bacterium]